MRSGARGALLLGGAAVVAAAAATPPLELELPSCVPGSPPLRAPATSERADLDPADRRLFEDAARARYPMYQRSGLAASRVLMLRRHGQWLFLSLAPRAGGDTCVSAVFAADRFDFTNGWIGKYRPRAGLLGD